MMMLRYSCSILFLSVGVAGFAQGDTCTNAWPVLSGFHHADGPTTGDGGSGCGGGFNGDWYRYTPSFTGTINISSCNSQNNITDDDTYVKVFSGACGGLSCIGFNDDMGVNSCPGYYFATYLDVAVTAGQTYYIVWTNMFDSDDFYWTLSECFGTVTGTTYGDTNGNGAYDVGEVQMDAVLEVNPGSALQYSGIDPYSFCTDSGSYTVTVPNPPLYHTVTPTAQSYSVSSLGTLVTGIDFGFQPVPGIYDGTVDLWGWNPWIGNNTQYHVNYANVGTEVIDGTVIVVFDPLTDFVSSTPAPDVIAGQSVSWNIAAMAPGTSGSINIVYHTDSTAQTTDMVTTIVQFIIAQNEQTPLNNMDHTAQHPTTSLDPNDKAVDVAFMTVDEVANGKPIEYTVHFQNTGTQPAVNIVLRDPVDADLDLSTFEMVGSTHATQISFNGGEIVWSFPNIMLPDSGSDQLGSQGGVHFRIKPKTGLLPGTLLENHADIYFDYNLPVQTNTVLTEITASEMLGDLARAHGMLVYPTPGNGQMHLLWAHASVDGASLEVLDATGRRLIGIQGIQLVEGQSTPLDLSALSNGNYLVRVSNEQVNLSTTATVQH